MLGTTSIIFVFLAIFNANVYCADNQLNLDDLKSKVPDGIIPDSFKNFTFPVEEIKTVLQDKCKKVSGDDKRYEAVEEAGSELMTCMNGLIDYEILQKEIDEAQPKGELDTVFNKYCAKREIAIQCLENFTSIIEPCLEPKEVEGKQTFVKIFKNILSFVCHKEGDQIALFIAEKGPECFDERKDDIITCMNATFYPHLPSQKELENKEIPKTLPELVMGEEQCDEMNTLQQCVVASLEKCSESTPANLVESMFKFVRNETPCVNFTVKGAPIKETPLDPSSGTLVTSSVLTIVSLSLIRLGLA